MGEGQWSRKGGGGGGGGRPPIFLSFLLHSEWVELNYRPLAFWGVA